MGENKVIISNVIFIVATFFYLLLRFSYLNEMIPFWYSMPWGESQLASKHNIFWIPIISVLILIGGVYLSRKAKNLLIRHGDQTILFVVTSTNILLTLSVFRIIRIASTPFAPLVSPTYTRLLLALLVSALISYVITPIFIKIAKNNNLVTDPKVHKHPGMILKKPSARGGGMVFAFAFVISALVFVTLTKQLIGILLAVIFTAIVGLLDDVANTNIRSRLGILSSPVIRLYILQPVSILFILAARIKTNFIGNPFDGIIFLDQFKITLFNLELTPIALLFTFLWVMWVINMLSWSNGVDGQYSGIIGIAGIIIALLSLRLVGIEPGQENTATLAAVMAGASFGLLPYTWQPSKIMWGFGATAAGIVLATLSIITRAKIATSLIVLLIPFMDALITVVRRILQGKSPLKGDGGHLHHHLLNRGWGVKKIAVFYWISTAAFGGIALVSSDRAIPLVILTLTGIVAFAIIALNLRSGLWKQK